MHLLSLKAGLAASLFALPALAMDGKIMVDDAFARASGPNAKSGAAFMMIMNHGTEDDRLIAATSDVAQRVELHTHIADGEGVMRMVEVEDGIAVPSGGMAMLKRGGDHVMFMGLNQPFLEGETIPVVLTFEKAGDIAVEIEVDLTRGAEDHGGHGSHGDHGDHDS